MVLCVHMLVILLFGGGNKMCLVLVMNLCSCSYLFLWAQFKTIFSVMLVTVHVSYNLCIIPIVHID